MPQFTPKELTISKVELLGTNCAYERIPLL